MEHKTEPEWMKTDKKGGYPAGEKTPGSGKPPPASMSKPRPVSK